MRSVCVALAVLAVLACGAEAGGRLLLQETPPTGCVAQGLLQCGNTSETYSCCDPASQVCKDNTCQLKPDDGGIDVKVLNFALNLECLEAEFYSYAAFGVGLSDADRGYGPPSVGGRKASLSQAAQYYATEIANDEIAHVRFLRAALGPFAVPCPAMDIGPAFAFAAEAAAGQDLVPDFDAYSGDATFFLAAFAFEDVGVSAYRGAAPFLENKDVLSAAAGILGTEAYHAGAVRSYILSELADTLLYGLAVPGHADLISNLRDAIDGTGDDDQGVTSGGVPNIVPTDSNAIAFARSPGAVIKIVTGGAVSNGKGLFFPTGLNTVFDINS